MLKLDNNVKLEILRKCFKKSMCNSSYFLDDEIVYIDIKNVGTIKFTGKGIKKYAKVYLCKFTSPEEIKVYNEYKSKLKSCYEVYRKVLDNKEEKDKIIGDSGLNLSYHSIVKKALKYCYTICNMSKKEVRSLYRNQGKYSLILDGLISLEKDEDIIKYLDKYCESDLKKITALRTAIFDYAIASSKLSNKEINNCIQNNNQVCLPKLFWGLTSGYRPQPHSGYEYGDVSGQLQVGNTYLEFKGIIKKNGRN